MELIVGLGAKPPGPTNLRVDTFDRTFESFQVSWDAVLLSDLPVYGYVLMMDDGLLSDLSTIYDGSTNP